MNAWPENEGLSLWGGPIKWKVEAYAVELEFVFEVHCNRRWDSDIPLWPWSTQQSMQWKHASSPSPRKFKVQASISWQDNVTTFWDAQSVLLTDFMLIRYDTRCYFNVRSKADMNRLNLPHGDCLTCLTKRQLQGFITLTYFTNCVPQLKTSAEESWPR